MRRSALIAGAGALLAAAAPALAQTGVAPVRPDYVPDDIWRDGDEAEFLEGWFGDQLHAMREPVLSHPGGLGRYRHRFRMLVLPNNDPAYAIRIDESQGGGRIRIVRLDGSGGYAPGRIARQRRLILTRDDVRALRETIRASGLAGMAVRPPPRQDSAPDPVTGERLFRICFHATYYVFELVAGRGSRFVVRNECEMPDALRTMIGELREARRDAGFQ
jgi:hypothetical protein